MEMSGGRDDSFEVSPSPEWAAESDDFEGTNVCRIAALSTMLGNDREAVRQLDQELRQLGFSDRIRNGDWSWAGASLGNATRQLRQTDDAPERRRIRQWQTINETAQPEDAIRFLIAVLGSRLERESAAAAAALWQLGEPSDLREFWNGPRWWRLWDFASDFEPGAPFESWWGFPWSIPRFVEADLDEVGDQDWDADRWAGLHERALSLMGDRYGDSLLIRMLTGLRLAQGVRSRDPVARSLAAAAFGPEPTSNRAESPPTSPHATPPGALVISMMIHGTWGWKGDWWRPQANNFHDFILRNHRPNLYSRGARFSWSGAYRESHRIQAASDFCDWRYEVAPHGLQTVLAHSYGGEVAARATLTGAAVAELILLSVPATAPVEAAADTGIRVVDVRLQFDPILALARTRQRLRPRPNVSEVLLRQWRYDHGASHREDVWRTEDVARRGGI